MRIVVATCNKSMWAMYPFAYLFNQYWSSLQSVTVLCESIPLGPLPSNFRFHQVDLHGVHGWPKERWTDGLVKFLHGIPEQQVILLLDDYWLIRTVDIRGVGTLAEYMRENENVLRIDLTTDRLYAADAKRPGELNHDNPYLDYGMYGHYDLISYPGSQYQMSLMPGIWNKARLLEVLRLDWSPWQVELEGTSVLNEKYKHLTVLGTRQFPLRFVNALRDGYRNVNTAGINDMHMGEIKKWIPEDYR